LSVFASSLAGMRAVKLQLKASRNVTDREMPSELKEAAHTRDGSRRI